MTPIQVSSNAGVRYNLNLQAERPGDAVSKVWSISPQLDSGKLTSAERAKILTVNFQLRTAESKEDALLILVDFSFTQLSATASARVVCKPSQGDRLFAMCVAAGERALEKSHKAALARHCADAEQRSYSDSGSSGDEGSVAGSPPDFGGTMVSFVRCTAPPKARNEKPDTFYDRLGQNDLVSIH
ncbi:MAG: hypothetical protein O3A01_07940 [bacterium]|nr:hypothetical protein [bacterium]